MKTFKLADLKKADPIEFELEAADGSTEKYWFNPGKKSSAIMALLVTGKGAAKELDRTAQLLNWFSNGLNPDHNEKHDASVADCQACAVEARVKDENDPLEFEHLIEVTTWLIGEVSGGRPTT